MIHYTAQRRVLQQDIFSKYYLGAISKDKGSKLEKGLLDVNWVGPKVGVT